MKPHIKLERAPLSAFHAYIYDRDPRDTRSRCRQFRLSFALTWSQGVRWIAKEWGFLTR